MRKKYLTTYLIRFKIKRNKCSIYNLYIAILLRKVILLYYRIILGECFMSEEKGIRSDVIKEEAIKLINEISDIRELRLIYIFIKGKTD